VNIGSYVFKKDTISKQINKTTLQAGAGDGLQPPLISAIRS
jgi:hypothetical protein